MGQDHSDEALLYEIMRRRAPIEAATFGPAPTLAPALPVVVELRAEINKRSRCDAAATVALNPTAEVKVGSVERTSGLSLDDIMDGINPSYF
jgi:hypothetical protein